MAKKINNSSVGFIKANKRKRPGVHSKCKNSNLKRSKNYSKKYKGQGK
jgi:hypothetical protein